MRAVVRVSSDIKTRGFRVAYLAVRETMEEASRLNDLDVLQHISVSSSRRRRYNVLVEGKRDKHNDYKEVHHRTHGPHSLRDLLLIHLAHVFPLQASLHKRRPQPDDHRIAGRVGNAAECERRDEGLAIAVEGIGDDAEAGEREREET